MANCIWLACHLTSTTPSYGHMAWPSSGKRFRLWDVSACIRPKIIFYFDSVQTQLWPCNSLRSHHQRYHVVYNWFLLRRDHGHGCIRGRFFFIWLKSLRNALMWDSEFHFIHLNIDFFIAFKRFCVHLWVSHETVVAWSLDDVMARAIQVLQGRSFRWHLIGGKTAACLPATVSFSGESSGNLLCKSKNIFCRSIPSFCSSDVSALLLCRSVCVCVGGGSHLFGDMLWYCILQELSPVLTGESNAKQHIHMSFRGRESSLSR